MAVTDFDTKVAVVVRDDLEMWQRLNVTAFLMSGATARAGEEAIGEPYTADMFATGNDDDNRAAVWAVATADLDLVGLAVRAPHRDADAVLRGLKRHP
jgi:hypothetical protein